jgi:hypothetical protein
MKNIIKNQTVQDALAMLICAAAALLAWLF